MVGSLGLGNGELDQLVLKFVDSFAVLPDSRDQLIKNLVYLARKADLDCQALVGRMSLVGRRAMLDIKTAPPTVDAIITFFKVCLQIEQVQVSAVLEQMLTLTVRLATDTQYGATREAAIELNASLQEKVGATDYLTAY